MVDYLNDLLNIVLIFHIQGNLLDTPKTEKTSEEVTTRTGLSIGATGMQGWRLEMEDAHIAKDMPSQDDHTFLAVFDG